MAGLVAVTGATGFIGTHVVRELAGRGWKVRILTRRIPGSLYFPLPPVDAVIGDLADPAALRRLVAGADAVIHLAGAVKAPSADAFHRANVLGTRAVVEAMAGQSRGRLIHVSSLAAREPQLSDYASSKAKSEDEVRKLSNGLDWIILRPSVVYGPGDRETLGFFQSAKRGISIIPGPPSQRISFLHINDLSRIFNVLIDDNLSSGILEVDDKKPGGYGWPEIVAAMSAATGKHLVSLHLPAAAVRLAAAVNAAMHRAAGRVTMFTPGKARELGHDDWVAHPSVDALSGWEPAHRLREGFEKTMLWYRSVGWL
jgi:2-alkyl-3-oxoalkanoate reductase